jgi:hypothetical protein
MTDITEIKTAVKSALLAGPTTIVFKKVDGTIRTMKCTLNEALLPVRELTESGRKVNDGIQTVYDLELNQWRSFKWDNFVSVTPGVSV